MGRARMRLAGTRAARFSEIRLKGTLQVALTVYSRVTRNSEPSPSVRMKMNRTSELPRTRVQSAQMPVARRSSAAAHVPTPRNSSLRGIEKGFV